MRQVRESIFTFDRKSAKISGAQPWDKRWCAGSEKARAALGASITWAAAYDWLNRVINDVAFRQLHEHADAWERGCRSMFLVKIRPNLV